MFVSVICKRITSILVNKGFQIASIQSSLTVKEMHAGGRTERKTDLERTELPRYLNSVDVDKYTDHLIAAPHFSISWHRINQTPSFPPNHRSFLI